MLPTVERRRDASIRESALHRAARRANDRLEFLLEASRMLSGSLDVQRTLDELCKLVAPRMADWCLVDLLDENGRLVLAASADTDPAKAALLRRTRRLYPPDPERHPAYKALASGRPEVISRVDDAFLAQSARTRDHLRLMRLLDPGPFVCVPLGVSGVLTLGYKKGGRLLGEEEARLAEELGRRAGAALSNALLYQKAREAEDKLGRALDAARMVAWDWDLKAGTVARSGPAAEVFGLSLRGLASVDGTLVHPEDRAARSRVLRRAIRKGGRYVARYRLLSPDGARWVEEHGSASGDHVSGVLMDVSGAVESDRLLRRQQAEQELILDTVEAMIWYKDDANNILRCNAAAAKWFGKTRRQVEGRSAYDLFPDEEARAFHDDDLEVLRSGRPRRGVLCETVNSDGERRFIRRDKIPFRDAEGNPGIVIFAVDITDQTKAEAALRESERLQREFVANVSHEFRTPVAAIKGFAETLRRGGLLDRRNRARFVRTIEAHAERLGWLVEDVLTLSALESGKPALLEPVDVSALLRDYAKSIAPVSRAKGVTVLVRAPEGLQALADQHYVLQIVENLVGNAIKFSKAGGKVWLSARAKGDELIVSVKDTGPGVPKAHLSRVFDRFFKVPGTGAAGTGLGLNIARRIVERHDGRIWAENARRGAAFHFTLKRARTVIPAS